MDGRALSTNFPPAGWKMLKRAVFPACDLEEEGEGTHGSTCSFPSAARVRGKKKKRESPFRFFSSLIS